MNQQRLRDRISDLFNPGRGGIFFFAGWVMLGLLGNAIYEFLKDLIGNSIWAHLGIAGGAALIFGVIYFVLWTRTRLPSAPVHGPVQMLLLDYGGHGINDVQLAQIEAKVGRKPEVRAMQASWNHSKPLAEYAVELADAAKLKPAEWQSAQLLLNPPGLSSVALALMAEVHGRCGYWPSTVTMRPVVGTTTRSFEVAEITRLQELRDIARERR